MPRWLAMSPTSVGSMPSTRWPPFWKFDSSVPSLEPISTTRSSAPRPSMRGGFALQVGEIVAQQLGGAAGVGIFRREDDDRIDREAELHQLAVAAVQQVGRKPRLLARHLADRHHLVDRRHVAEREHVIERCVAADLTAFDRNAGAGAGGARDFAGTQGVSLRAVDASGFRRQVGVAPVPVERRLEALVERHARLIAQPGEFRNVGTAARRAARRSFAGNQLDLAPGRARDRAAPGRRS